MQTNEIDVNVSVEQFLNAKFDFLTAQIESFKSELEHIKKLKAALKDVASPVEDISLATKKREVQPVIGVEMPGFGIVNQKTVKSHVEEFLKNNRGKYLTAEIFTALQKKLDIPQLYRKAFIASISLSLHGLINLAIPKVKKTDTDDVNAKAYEWIG